jgi:hypothetical protein
MTPLFDVKPPDFVEEIRGFCFSDRLAAAEPSASLGQY